MFILYIPCRWGAVLIFLCFLREKEMFLSLHQVVVSESVPTGGGLNSFLIDMICAKPHVVDVVIPTATVGVFLFIGTPFLSSR